MHGERLCRPNKHKTYIDTAPGFVSCRNAHFKSRFGSGTIPRAQNPQGHLRGRYYLDSFKPLAAWAHATPYDRLIH